MSQGEMSMFFTRPLSLTFLICGAALFCSPFVIAWRRRRERPAAVPESAADWGRWRIGGNGRDDRRPPPSDDLSRGVIHSGADEASCRHDAEAPRHLRRKRALRER